MALRFIRLTASSLRAAFAPVVIRMISCHWVIGFGLALVVVQFILETSSQLRIYFGRALPNWGVVVSHPSTSKGAATLATQQSLANNEGVCHITKWWILWLFQLQKVNFAPTYIISVKIQKKYIKQFAYFDNSLYLCIVIKKQGY